MTTQPSTTQPSTNLETFPAPEGAYVVRWECPEFTCLCPKTGQPDFAYIRVWYLPDKKCVELKALKLYLWSYRDKGAFHEAVTNQIRDDLVKACEPCWMLVEGNFWVRGGIHTVVFATHETVPEALLTARMVQAEYQGH